MGFIVDMLPQAFDDATRDTHIKRMALLQKHIATWEIAV